jgi:hypothetical protein
VDGAVQPPHLYALSGDAADVGRLRMMLLFLHGPSLKGPLITLPEQRKIWQIIFSL